MNPPLSARAARSEILLVTPAPERMRELLLELDRHGLQAVCARDVAAGAALADAGIALILLDAALAEPDLAGACARLTQATGEAAAPLFLLSATPSAAEQSRSIGAGAAEYIKLPCCALELTEQILVELALRETPAAPSAPSPLHPQTLEVNYHSVLAGSPDAVVLLDVDNARLIDANHRAAHLFGRSVDALLQGDLAALCPQRQADGRLSADIIAAKVAEVLSGQIGVFEAACLRHNAAPVECEMRLVMLSVPGRRLVHARIVDLTERKRAEALRAGQHRLLEMIAQGAPLQQTLDQLMLLIEAQSPGAQCALLLLDHDGRRMRCASGPSLPAPYLAALDGMEIGPTVGSCGSAMFRKQAVLVSDMLNDPLWQPYLALVEPYGLRACWAMPILHQEQVLGTFSMYYRAPRRPTPEELRLIDVAIHIAGIAIGRTRHEQELQRHREHLEELVAERTVALTRAKEQADLVNEELANALENLSITQEELLRRDKLAALGTLVAGIAHELNTPIGNSLVVCSTMAERTRQLRDSVASGLRRSTLETYLGQAAEADAIVLRNLQRAANLVSSFKEIAVDRASSQRRCFALDQFIADLMLTLAAPLRDSGFTLRLDIAPRLLMDSYPGALSQALAYLFENCVRHGFEGRSHGRIAIRAAAADDGEIALSIADNGVGIAAADLRHIYDPFFTTKLGSGGSGLGLHITHNLVSNVLGGRIDVASDAASGTTFTLYLPATAPAAQD